VNEARERSWLEVRYRQFRNPPVPVFRAVVANLVVAVAGGILLLAYDVAVSRGVALPGGDLRAAAVAGFVALVAVAGTSLTYLWVPLPTGSTGVRRRSAWSGLLGLFAALPIGYIVLVVVFQVLRPLLR
jgi:hypothetical protein